MADVFRGKYKAWGKDALIGYSIHGVTAVLALWMFLKALA